MMSTAPRKPGAPPGVAQSGLGAERVSYGVLLNRSDLDPLRRAANRRDLSVAQMLRRLIRDFLAAEAEANRQEATDA